MDKKICDLSTPCFLVDLEKTKRNCEHMIRTCKELNLRLRPHTKTHKTIEAAILQTNGTKRCIAVSTLAEAEFYANNGFDDILLAYPVTEDKIQRCLALVKQLDKFQVMVSGNDGLQCLEDHISDLPEGKVWFVVIEVDLGYGRTGFPWDSGDLIKTAKAVSLATKMKLEQLYAHCGNSYAVKSIKERQDLQYENIARLRKLQAKLNIDCSIGVGSTPTCSLPLDDNKLLSEFHPGNYVFYDYMQHLIGSCTESSIACRVMTRVTAHKQEKNTILIDCGFTALGHDGKKERLPLLDFCLIQGESNLKLIEMSQEIGKIAAKEGELDCRLYPIGTILYIIPYHSCCTSALHAEYQVHVGDAVVETWKPVRGW
uniref:D-serine dehydratase-like domain-containing protein n=1 Tax=Biomphalaria glabrata TaxID=6526 RepID=A0A2C9LN28_BIOGL